MKKEWLIISLLIIIILLIIIPMFSKTFNKYNKNNDPNNISNKPVLINNSKDDCKTQLIELERQIISFNYCTVDSDCIKKNLGIMDFCNGHLINKNVNLNEFDLLLNKYQSEGCSEPINDCFEINSELKCENKKCVYKIVKENIRECTGDSDCEIGYKCYYESPTTLREGIPGSVNKPGICIKLYNNIQE